MRFNRRIFWGLVFIIFSTLLLVLGLIGLTNNILRGYDTKNNFSNLLAILFCFLWLLLGIYLAFPRRFVRFLASIFSRISPKYGPRLFSLVRLSSDDYEHDENELKNYINILKSGNLNKAHKTVTQLKQKGWLLDGELSSEDLSGINISGTDLTGADLSSVNLIKANLSKCDLTAVDLTYAKLVKVNFTEADLTSAKLTGADITGADFSGAILKNTTMPNGEIYVENQPLSIWGAKF